MTPHELADRLEACVVQASAALTFEAAATIRSLADALVTIEDLLACADGSADAEHVMLESGDAADLQERIDALLAGKVDA